MKSSQLERRLAELESFSSARPEAEQVATPPVAAAKLLLLALGRGDLEGATVADLGCGPGFLAIGAAWLGARDVVGVESDSAAIEVARRNVQRARVSCRLVLGSVEAFRETVDTVVMNPPFGAQRRGADRPFWAVALRFARRAVYSFALRDSRTFIAREAVARGANIEATEPVPWKLPRTFSHHREAAVDLPVDLWVLRIAAHP